MEITGVAMAVTQVADVSGSNPYNDTSKYADGTVGNPVR